MSEGAAVSFEDLLLLNLRGDVGAGDAAGCSDLGWRRERSFVAHNEDGAPEAATHMTVLTLYQDGRAPVTALWYPDFVPANAFTVTGHGLVCGNDHIPVEPPAIGPGRHFVARGLSEATDLDAVVRNLRAHPGAGGFTYTLGECGTGRVAVVECAGGEVAVTELDKEEPLR